MVDNFRDVYARLQDTVAYTTFKKEKPEYVLAHGFLQLDANAKVSKPWHVGFYSPKQDDLAIFTSPDFGLSFDKAFKDGGTIAPLQWMESFKTTEEVFAVVREQLKNAHPQELPFTYLFILQTIDAQPRYNVTVVTQSFKMLNFLIDPLTATVVKETAQSVMDLKASE
jgi:hypothetical protein